MPYSKRQRSGTERERRKNRDGNDRVETFWTVCSYCNYVFEYLKVYQDCCLRCQNCRNAFDGVAINGTLPQIVRMEGKEQYNCCSGPFKLYYDQEKIAGINGEIMLVDISDKKEHVPDSGCNGRKRRGIAHESNGASRHQKGEELREKRLRMDKSKEMLMADHLEEGLNVESRHERESELCDLEILEEDDDIYVGLSDLW